MDLHGRRTATATLKDVARAAGVHYSTASRALDPAKRSLVRASTAAQVQEVAERLGYRQHLVARSLRRGRTHTIGIVIPDLDNPCWAPVLHALTGALDESGYLIVVCETLEDQRRYQRLLEKLAAWRVDAVISAATRLADANYLREFSRNGVPILLAVRTLPTHEFINIGEDSARGGAMAAKHLVQLGHRVLAQLHGPLDVQFFRERGRGFSNQTGRYGAQVVDFSHFARAPNYEEGRRLMNLLLDHSGDALTAVFAHNDQMAIGALDVLAERGVRCPQDMSVIGYNDSPLVDHVSPPLSTVRLPASELGTLAGEAAIRLVERADAPPGSASVPPRLVVRASTAPPRHV
jgi:LacI family transcriptional regulator